MKKEKKNCENVLKSELIIHSIRGTLIESTYFDNEAKKYRGIKIIRPLLIFVAEHMKIFNL